MDHAGATIVSIGYVRMAKFMNSSIVFKLKTGSLDLTTSSVVKFQKINFYFSWQ